MELKDKTVLITGSSSGIGKAIAIECAKKGAHVLIHYRKNQEGANETLKEVEKYSKGKVFSADLSEASEVKKLFSEFKKESLELDMLVNNAGESMSGKLDDLDLWESQWKNIFMTQLNTVNEFIKSSDSKNLRKIVSIGSIYGISEMADVDFPQYSSAKAAVHNLSLNLAKKLAPSVLVNVVAPGWVWTPPWEGTPDAELEKLKSFTKIKRFINPEEIAKVVVTLLENDAITGEIIRIDGGLHFPTIS